MTTRSACLLLLSAVIVTAGCGPEVGSVPTEPATSGADQGPGTPKESRGDRERKQPPRVIVVKGGGAPSGRLAGELIRQSLIITAREEFGVPVRDGGIGETAAPDEPGRWFLNLSSYPTQGTDRVSVIRNGPDGRGAWGPPLTIDLPAGTIPPRLFGAADADSRATPDLSQLATKAADLTDDFAAYLRDVQGLKPQQPDTAAAAPIDDIELRLREMSFVAQFEAIQAAHRLPRGAAKDRLLALGYANLGMLTQHLWGPESKVFAARSLLYAERVARAEPGVPAEEARAYAAALAGLHSDALRHVAAAGGEPSPRLQVVSAYCRFRDDELLALAEKSPEVRELAAALACLVVKPTGLDVAVGESYSASVEAAPDCFRVYDAVAAHGLIRLLHDVTRRAPDQLSRSVPSRLNALPGLPDQVRELTSGPVIPAELAGALEEQLEPADVAPEPAWPVLGRLIRAEALVQAHRRLAFLRSPLGVPAGEEHAALREFVGGHHLAAILDTLSDRPDVERIREAVESWSRPGGGDPVRGEMWAAMSDFGPQHEPLVAPLVTRSVPGLELSKEAMSRLGDYRDGADWVADDLVSLMDGRPLTITGASFTELHAAAALDRISPHHPFRLLARMKQEEATPEQLAVWERECDGRPALMVPLAETLLTRGQADDAARVAAEAAALDPSFEAYDVLSRAQRAAGRETEYLEAAERSFEQTSYGLTDAYRRADLARAYMARGEAEKARPHVEAAAETYAATGMYVAVDYYTRVRDWEAAESWAQRLSLRYPGSCGAVWHMWCRQTGRGEADPARAIADATFASLRDSPAEALGEAEVLALAVHEAVAGNDGRAGELRERLARLGSHPGHAIVSAVSYLRAGRKDAAATVLADAAGWTTSYPQAGDAARRAGVFRDALSSGEALDAETVAEFEAAVASWPVEENLAWRTYFGEMFLRLGNREEGLRLLRGAAEDESASPYDPRRVLAAIWLRGHGERLETDADASTDEPDV